MDKLIDKLLKSLKLEMLAGAVALVLVVVLGECGVIPNGVVEAGEKQEFLLIIAVVALTLVAVPLAIKLFTLNTTRSLRRMNIEEALQSYHIWSIVRLSILMASALGGLVVYYLTVNTSAVFCALIAVTIALTCYPSRSAIKEYLEQMNNDNQNIEGPSV